MQPVAVKSVREKYDLLVMLDARGMEPEAILT